MKIIHIKSIILSNKWYSGKPRLGITRSRLLCREHFFLVLFVCALLSVTSVKFVNLPEQIKEKNII